MIAYNLTSYDLPKPKRSYVKIFIISFLVLLGAYLFYFLLFGERGLVHYYQVKKEINLKIEKIKLLEEELEAMKAKIEKNKLNMIEEWGPIEKDKLEKFDFEENDKIFYIIPKFKEGIENLDNKNCFLWYDGTKFCLFK